jgi:hypothetical protein
VKKTRFLLILAAFLVMISSTLILFGRDPYYPVYLNIAAMVAIAVAVSIKKK